MRDVRNDMIALCLERVKLKEKLRAEERVSRRWEKLPLVLASAIIIALGYLIWQSSSDAEIRQWMKDFQTLCGATGAIAAALIAYHGSGAAAREARRKDKMDRHEKMITQIILTRFHAIKLETELNVFSSEIKRSLVAPAGTECTVTSLPSLESVHKMLEGIGILPEAERDGVFSIAQALAALHTNMKRVTSLAGNLTADRQYVSCLKVFEDQSKEALDAADALIASLMRY